jgi:hypothetical protein
MSDTQPPKKAMFSSAKFATKRFAMKARIVIEGTMVLFVLLCFIGVKTHHLRGDVEFPGISFGGGTEEQQAALQQKNVLQAALPASALSPVEKVAAIGPMPSHKPVQ